MRTKDWLKCDNCSAQTKSLRPRRSRLLCYKCYQKEIKIIPGNFPLTLEEALKKTDEVKTYRNKDGAVTCSCSFPSALAGSRFKIQLVGEA